MGSWYSSAGRWSLLVTGLTAALVLGACSSSDDDAAKSTVESMGGSAGSAGESSPDELAFLTPAIEMAPGEAQTIAVEVKPAGQYEVRFALLGNSADASLDRTSVVSDQDGAAQVVLTAPTKPSDATFTIRASVGQTIAAEAQVTVTSGGRATLKVVPKYSGQREIASWTASAHPGVACAELTGTPPPDSYLVVDAKAPDAVLRVDVPAGRDLAVAVRSDYKVAGCLDVPPLAVNEDRTVEVVTIDVPLQLEGLTLGTRIDLGHPDPSWPSLVEAKMARFELALLAKSEDDVDALLDEMTAVAVTQDLGVNLDDARNNGGWDGALTSQYGNESATVMRAPLRSWYRAAANQMDKSAPLEAVLEPITDVKDEARLSPDTFCGLPAADMGFPQEVSATWLVKPNDQVLIGASFDWLPWIAFTRLAEQQAAVATGILDVDMLTALEDAVDCDATATNLRNRALAEMGGCGQDCMVGVCESAVENLWNRANSAVVSATAKLDLSIAATVTVDEHARPTEFVGEWIATIDTGDEQAQTSGVAEGWTPEDDSAAP